MEIEKSYCYEVNRHLNKSCLYSKMIVCLDLTGIFVNGFSSLRLFTGDRKMFFTISFNDQSNGMLRLDKGGDDPEDHSDKNRQVMHVLETGVESAMPFSIGRTGEGEHHRHCIIEVRTNLISYMQMLTRIQLTSSDSG